MSNTPVEASRHVAATGTTPNAAVQEANAVPETPNTAVRGPLLINAVQTASINGSTGDNTIGVAVQTASSTPIAPTGNNAIHTGPTESISALSRLQEQEMLSSLKLTVGSRAILTWRSRETLDAVAGEWFTTPLEIVEVSEASVPWHEGATQGRSTYTTSFLWEGEELQGCLPLQFEYEMARIARVRAPARSMTSIVLSTSAKRVREEPNYRLTTNPLYQSTPQQPDPPAHLAMAKAHASMDVRRGKATAEVKGGDGLRVPATISSLWSALYPHVWLARREAGEDPGEVEEAWRLNLTYLQAYLGVAIKNPAKRDESIRATENVTTMVYRRYPQSKMAWQGLNENCFILLHHWFVILHGKVNGDSFLAKC
jgi:hypothetical protein